MRKTARYRMVPQSRSTDPRIGRVSLKAAILYDRMWINADAQGRITGDPDELKYSACPNLPDISKEDIPQLLKDLAEVKPGLILLYPTGNTAAIQMIDWWDEQNLQWAPPSTFPPPEGWTDHLRYHVSPKEIITENWPPTVLPSTLPSTPGPALERESTKEKDIREEKKKKKIREDRNLPSTLGSTLASLLVDLPLFNHLFAVFPEAYGRKPNSRETALLRGLGQEISSAGGATAQQIHDAFKEACDLNKLSIGYIRAVLLDWLGVKNEQDITAMGH